MYKKIYILAVFVQDIPLISIYQTEMETLDWFK